jgi:ribosome-associated heat shock protein Hsp15
MAEPAAPPWQRLDKWLFCARVRRSREDCARLVMAGWVRVNRQRVEKPDFRLRIGDVLTLADGRAIRVLRVARLAPRRLGAEQARALYDEIPDAIPAAPAREAPALSCADREKAAYREP